MQNQKLQTLSGFRDFLPAEKQKRDYVVDIIRKCFESYGFLPIETPTLEQLALFEGQIGEDEKLFYKFKDYGGRDVALRYDQTVPSARFVAQYQNELVFPFKRYQIQNVFRAEKPQRGRYREFMQCDADIFGTTSPYADAEVIALSLEIYRQIGFKNVTALISDRALMKDIPYAAIVAIDKLKKIGKDGVIQEMIEKGIAETEAKSFLNRIETMQPNDRLNTIFSYLESAGFPKEWYRFEPTIARSFSYSDGPIWEIVVPEFTAGSVMGGERYDGLVNQISGRDIPATGFAIGFDRTIEAAEQLGILPASVQSVKVLVTLFDEKTVDASIKITTQLREAGIITEIYPALDKLGKQFKLADQQQIPFVVIIGEEEQKNQQITLKNMKTGEQALYSEKELILELQK
ncbi:MAG: histidine--tRNA ligase [Patescibacteria group bacterium]